MKLLILGANGMVGHLFALYFKEKGHDVTGFCRSGGCPVASVRGDARDFSGLDRLITEGRYDAVINCVGVLNKDCERDKENAIILNTLLPVHLAKITADLATRIIHISTDCVFSGKKGAYSVTDEPDGADAYARTKALGELTDGKNLTLRTSVVGPDPDPCGKGLLNWFLQQHGTVSGYTGSVWNGLTTTELAHTTERCLRKGITGLIQPVPACPVNKYELLLLFKKAFGREDISVVPVPGVVHNKSLLPSCSGIEQEIPSYEEMLKTLSEWVSEHKALYPHYCVKPE